MKQWKCSTILALQAVLFILFTNPLLADDYGVAGDDFIVDDSSPNLLAGELSEQDGVLHIYDPLEPFNRAAFVFNDRLYFWVLKPIKEGYVEVLPADIRGVIGNFFQNLSSPVYFANNLLQGRFSEAGTVLSRFAINSTIGVFGFGDIAAEEFDMTLEKADFGQTLGVYGLGEGVYICWPVFGPSNIRDTVGLLGDMQLHPYNYADIFDTTSETISRGTEFINRLANTGDAYEEIVRISLDPYVATREAYIDYRRSLILLHKREGK